MFQHLLTVYPWILDEDRITIAPSQQARSTSPTWFDILATTHRAWSRTDVKLSVVLGDKEASERGKERPFVAVHDATRKVSRKRANR
ncbi:hypothetical protein JMJ77_0008051 [Colletotrichum scovillei]|uniref:Uncharacterized protein n=1 Tax=Colletotrichum scovillei TaxID=1209932 RepID=A0A9P7RE09_9PEZI|nr:hypothetical protein JMJ77_0008051 [Colletotrichum scovillei]KAG7075072.1 hypothetical protein JMJ76_0011535 [Colletotrichum scovillei]KAG7082379.1 hypothetical protein JMJ78_0004481 [Colletotrichum scovillei]